MLSVQSVLTWVSRLPELAVEELNPSRGAG